MPEATTGNEFKKLWITTGSFLVHNQTVGGHSGTWGLFHVPAMEYGRRGTGIETRNGALFGGFCLRGYAGLPVMVYVSASAPRATSMGPAVKFGPERHESRSQADLLSHEVPAQT